MDEEGIKVEQGEMTKANSPDTLRSGGLGPCIAIGVYDPQTRSGYMMHEPQFEYANLDQQIRDIETDYKDLTRLRIFATGNSLSSDDDEAQRKYEENSRDYVEKTLRKYFNDSQLKMKWMPDDHYAELFLHLSNGEFELEFGNLDELLEDSDY